VFGGADRLRSDKKREKGTVPSERGMRKKKTGEEERKQLFSTAIYTLRGQTESLKIR